MRIGSLFSGIGGLELGLEDSGLGHTVWQVEQSEFYRKVLARHWPDAERFEDVREAGSATLAPVDLICGGFPCQDISSAGKGAGLAGSRSGLWYEFARVLGEMRPSWVVVENVASGAKRWVDSVRADLGRLDYETLPIPLSAFDVGAPHLRRRVFIIGHTHRNSKPTQPINGEVARVQSDSGSPADADREPLRQQPGGGRGASRQKEGVAGDDGTQGAAADADGARPQGTEQAKQGGRARVTGRPWAKDPMPEPALRRVDDGLSAVVGRKRSVAPLRGARRRRQELKSLGNAVVPQCAEVIGHVIQELMRC